jgi:coenzyme F420-0:L-glutamate ligase / coenzyme F420-1:gamma-L-glutamate ligase
MTGGIEILPLPGMPEITAGSELGPLLGDAARTASIAIASEDIIVVSQKVVSKAEGRIASLDAVEPGGRARQLGDELGRDPRLVQLVLEESTRIVRAAGGVLIVETVQGWVCANAGIDASNVQEGWVTLLPVDADASARRIRDELMRACGARPAVIVADSFGRAWRLGQVDVAIGCAGLTPIDDWRGRQDRHGRELTATAPALADEIAAAADLARDKASGMPAAVVRGVGRHVHAEDGPGATAVRRPSADDLFR